MGSLKNALLFVPRLVAGLFLMMAALLLFGCSLFMLMALTVVGWIRDTPKR